MKRRNFLLKTLKGGIIASLPISLSSFNLTNNKKVEIGIVADVHQDIIHDGVSRISFFIDAMEKRKPDFIIQLGDFSLPRKQNQPFIDKWNSFNGPKYHVLGNHDMKDFGFKKEETMKWWKMKKRYYSFDYNNLDNFFTTLKELFVKKSNNISQGIAHFGFSLFILSILFNSILSSEIITNIKVRSNSSRVLSLCTSHVTHRKPNRTYIKVSLTVIDNWFLWTGNLIVNGIIYRWI
jgi:predicted MPP superfamily phosphohydrolase